MRSSIQASRHSQQGITLVVALLLMVVISLFAVASFNASTTNMRVTGNMIGRQEATAAAQELIDDTISDALFSTNPTAVAAAVHPVDIDNDGDVDYTPILTPVPFCQRSRPLKVLELDPALESDLACMTSGVVSHSGLDTADLAGTAGDSMCANTEWNIRAQVDDPASGTQVAVVQGVGVRVLASEAEDFCL